jgi:hypothetical protein
MSASDSCKRDLDELAKLADEILHRKIEPLLTSDDAGKFVAIDVDSADFEVHEDDLTAVRRLKARRPSAQAVMCRVGYAAAYKMGIRGSFQSRWP